MMTPILLEAWKKMGADFVQQHGLPTQKDERWKYTSIKILDQYPQTPNLDASITQSLALPLVFDHDGLITLVNGVYNATQSVLPNTVRVLSLQDAAEQEPDLFKNNPFEDHQFFGALNAQHSADGVVIIVPAKTKCKNPILILHTVTDKSCAMPRIMIVAEKESEATFVDIYHGEGSYFTNIVQDIFVHDAARLHHYRWQTESLTAAHITTGTVYVGRDASYDSFTLTTGANFSRHDITAHIIGQNAECRLNGAYMVADHQHTDTTILMHHKQPHGRSNQTFKGIIDDHARAVFQGKVFVHQIAQKTDGYQLNNALLLSNTAEVDVKPELEIYADDVKCSHGATTGQLDTGPLFYLRTRGLSEAQAKFLLMQAFLGPALEEIRDETVREIFTDLSTKWLAKRAGVTA